MSLRVSCKAQLIDELDPPLTEGSRIVVWGKPEYWAARGTLTFAATEIRPVGVGALLARIEALRDVLAAEGLFAAGAQAAAAVLARQGRPDHRPVERSRTRRRRERPTTLAVGRVPDRAGRGAGRRTPSPRSSTPCARLEADPEVDVIVIARGGGSMEDLLPFSDEALVRAVAGLLHTGRLSDRARDRHTARRPRRRCACVDADRRREADRSRHRRGARANPHGGAVAPVACIADLIETEQHRLDTMRTRPSLADPSGVLAAWEGLVVDPRPGHARDAVWRCAQASDESPRLRSAGHGAVAAGHTRPRIRRPPARRRRVVRDATTLSKRRAAHGAAGAAAHFTSCRRRRASDT